MFNFFARRKEESYLQSRERTSLLQSIRSELKSQDALRKSTLEELTSRRSPRRILQHPAMLLLMGSVLTGFIGTYVAHYWQSEEWNRQQAFLANQHSLEEKHKIANQTAKAIGEIHAATLSLLTPMQDNDARTRRRELEIQLREWKQAKARWRVESSVLLAQIAVHYPPQGQKDEDNTRLLLAKIFNHYHRKNVEILNMMEELRKHKWKRTDAMLRQTGDILEELNSDIRDQETRLLMDLMARRIHEASSMPASSGFFRGLWRTFF